VGLLQPIYVEVEVPANPNALRSHALGGLVRHQTVVQCTQRGAEPGRGGDRGTPPF